MKMLKVWPDASLKKSILGSMDRSCSIIAIVILERRLERICLIDSQTRSNSRVPEECLRAVNFFVGRELWKRTGTAASDDIGPVWC